MSYNGSGTFVINTAGQPVVSGTVISSTAFNALTADLATGLSTAITKDGQTTPTANIPMGNNKITNLAVGTAATDAANLSQVQSTTAKLVNSISGADTITGTMSPTLGAYATGQMFYFIAAGDNTGAVTLNIDSLGAKAVTRDGSVALAAGDIKSGEVVVVVYDGTRFQVVSQINSSGNATFANVSITSALNVGGVATFSAGTAAAPSITTSGDTNNGIFFPATDVTAITTAGSERLRVDASGNMGLGVTPSAWSGSGYFKAFQIAELGASLSANTATYSGGSNVFLGNNGYHQDSDLTWRYTISQPAAQYRIGATGVHSWHYAASGTAGNAITFTQAMTLNDSGQLLVGATTAVSARGEIRLGGNASGSLFCMGRSGTNKLNIGVDSSDNVDIENTANTPIRIYTNSAERARITSGGDFGIGTTSPQAYTNYTVLTVDNATNGGVVSVRRNGTALLNLYTASGEGKVEAANSAFLSFSTSSTERARISLGGTFSVGTTSANPISGGVAGVALHADGNQGLAVCNRSQADALAVGRLGNDGTLVSFYQDGTAEGTISVSGNTVSYNAFAGSHWSQLQDGSKPDILRGTVMESINELCEWPDETNERLPKSKISDTAGSKKVYGVFMAWDNDWTATNDMYVTAVGAFICRVNGSVTVQEGDLLESNGDGTARVQADDIIRSSTIGKVTSTVKTHQYDDGSYCVPTVLYCG